MNNQTLKDLENINRLTSELVDLAEKLIDNLDALKNGDTNNVDQRLVDKVKWAIMDIRLVNKNES